MATTIDGSAGVTTNVGAVYNGLQSATAQATTSGTSITFTGIPSWVKRITVMFNNISTSGTSIIQVQIGSGSVTTTGYNSQCSAGGTGSTATTGFILNTVSVATTNYNGSITLSTLGSNVWVESGLLAPYSTATGYVSGGNITLGGTLDRVVLTTVNGTDTFDAGSVNIIYE